jgi:hypothetical protein
MRSGSRLTSDYPGTQSQFTFAAICNKSFQQYSSSEVIVMKRMFQGLFFVSLLILLQNTSALADVTNIIGGIICGSSDCSPAGAQRLR